MDIAITPLQLILQAAKKIQQISKNVKANKKQCAILSERVQIINDLVEKLKLSPQDLSNLRNCLQQTKDCLNDCIIFISNFTEKGSWFRKIMDHSSNAEKFKELNDTLQKCITTFTLGMAIDAKIERAFDRAQDVAAAQEDRRQIEAMQELILQAHQLEQAKLQQMLAEQQRDRRALVEQQRAQKLQAEFMQQQLDSIRRQFAGMALPAAAVPRLPVDKNLIIKLDELEIFDVIGDGSKATVFAGKLYGIDVAVKKLKQLTPEGRVALFREATILSRLRGEHVVKISGVCIEEGSECLVMELMQGSLKAYIEESKPLNDNLIKQLALEIALGIQSLHRQHTIHRDLKSANILLTKDSHAKLADFDLAVMDTSSLKAMDYTSTAYEYMAPELLQLKPQAVPASDIYSYGGILFELITRKAPPREKTKALLQTVPQPYQDIIASCWQANPAARMPIELIIKTISEYQPPDMRALYQTGAEHEKAGRLDAARACYLQSAELGYGRSEFRVGMFYLQGKAGSSDKPKAFAYFKKAATHESHDQAKACFNLGLMLETGDGVERNLLQAYRWYKEAARLGNEDAAVRAKALQPAEELKAEDNAESLGLVTQTSAQTVRRKI